MADQPQSQYTLHYFPFSLYSLMARTAFVIGKHLNTENAPKINIQLVNMHRDEHLSEQYLSTISPKGQVPALSSVELSSPLTDSQDISDWLCERQPELVPAEYRDVIERLMDRVYAFHAKALMVPAEERAFGVPNEAAERLERSDISDGYRRALEIKSLFHDTKYGSALEVQNIEIVEAKAEAFVMDLGEVLTQRQSEGPWIFGDRPTIIDAHAAAMIIRLIDVKRTDFVPENVLEYARQVKATSQWQEVTLGRATNWDVSMGHAADLEL